MAINEITELMHINLLLSPVNPISINVSDNLIKKPFTLLKNVTDIGSIIASSRVVIASYGHLAYEALALKVPVCLVAQKQFQAEYAIELEKRNFCVFAGNLSHVSTNNLVEKLRDTLSRSDELVLNASRYISGGGLKRIAEIIVEKTGRGS